MRVAAYTGTDEEENARTYITCLLLFVKIGNLQLRFFEDQPEDVHRGRGSEAKQEGTVFWNIMSS